MKEFAASTFLIVGCVIALSWGQQAVPEDARRHMVRGQAAVETAKSSGDYKDAIAEFEQALKLAPDWPDAYFNLGMVQGAAGDYDEAIINLKKYLDLVPNAEDAAQVKDNIYKLEYKRERSNIEGIWKVDKNELAVQCDPPGYVYGKGHIISSVFMIEDLMLEVRKNSGGMEARVLSSRNRFNGTLPDGSYVPVRREGDIVKIFDIVFCSCQSVVINDQCPWTAKLVLKQTAADVLEGTIEAWGRVKKVISYRTFTLETAALGCNGKIILRKRENTTK